MSAADPTRLPHDWPPLIEAGGRLAAEYANACGDVRGSLAGSHYQIHLPTTAVEAHIARTARTLLLSDLTRPESRDHWVRWLAWRVGLDAGDGAVFCLGERWEGGAYFWLEAGNHTRVYASESVLRLLSTEADVIIPELADLSTPAALVVVCLAVGA
jgi:hypothetical protein